MYGFHNDDWHHMDRRGRKARHNGHFRSSNTRPQQIKNPPANKQQVSFSTSDKEPILERYRHARRFRNCFSGLCPQRKQLHPPSFSPAANGNPKQMKNCSLSLSSDLDHR
ncbi:hypothetical protein AVEN_43590-1 [Araneus ventricosus]|uniref:Uncharacterized protein n=1 Tax=Araneus ventricosus TaxID=182803 RepID=A0A4Y2EKP7_ARAVE|nr:hypothetical protein AVEN_43590-1 [Araneus ventricosus]